ncbi:polygalacturonase [Pedobacter sp. UYEF25]
MIYTICFFLSTIISIFSTTTILNVTDFGANGNDKVDDTIAFQHCADKLATLGGGTINIPKGAYFISHLTFFGKKYSNITIQGNGSTIYQVLPKKRVSVENGRWWTFATRKGADGCFVFDANVSNQQDDHLSIKNIIIENLTFFSDVKKNKFDELMHQISAHGVSNFLVKNCKLLGFLGDGIAINAATDYSTYRNAYNKNIKILNCTFDGINNDNRQGVSIYYADGFAIEHCVFKNTTRADMPGAIDLEPNDDRQVLRNGIVKNCTFENIGGLSAIMIHTPKSSSLNNFSNRNFIVDSCTFKNIRAPLCIVGNENYMDYSLKESVIQFKNSSVKNAEAIADMRSAFGVLIDRVEFYNISNTGLNTVTEIGAKEITFKNCLFDGVKNNNGIGFYGKTRNINFMTCTFKNFAANAITINDPSGIGTISNNIFYSSDYGDALPIVTSTIANKSIISNAHIADNKIYGNFKKINIQQFYQKFE